MANVYDDFILVIMNELMLSCHKVTVKIAEICNR